MTQGDRPDEARAAMIELTGAGRPLGPIGERSSRAVVAAIGLVAVLGLVAFIGFVNRGPAPPSASPPAAAVAPSSTPPGPATVTPLGPEFPPTIDGLTVRSVSAAVPDGPSPSGLIAVGGYLSNDRSPEGCPPAPSTDKPNPCSGTQLVLIDDPASVLQPNDATFLYDIVVPQGLPSIQPVVLPGTNVPDPWARVVGLAANAGSRPVVLVGQFGDRRSPQCAPRPGGGNAGCDRSFVIDQLAWIAGANQGPSVFQGPGSRGAHDPVAVEAAVAGWFLPGSTPAIVSITSSLPADAPTLAGISLDGRGPELFWIVRVVSSLADGPRSSILVFDDRTLGLVGVFPAGS